MKTTRYDLILSPHSPCGESEQACPLMRVCPVCDAVFTTAGRRRQHQNHCSGAIDTVMVEAQHEHVVNVHRIRTRHSGRARG